MLAAAARPSPFQLRGVDRRPSAPARRPVVAAATWGSSDAPERPQAPLPSGGAVPLAGGGALWWQSLHSGGTRPVYGPLTHDTFVMQRPEIGGPGLVRMPRQPKPVRTPVPPPATPPVVWVGPPAAGALTLAGSSVGSCSVVIDTDFVVLPSQQQQAAVQPNTSCVGIVWQGSVEGEASDETSAAAAARGRKRSRHPRRTQTLRFTCNLCGESNDCEINPHAWAKGSVFARCQGCTAVHKLKDNLRIFHELAGPVFPPRDLRSTYLVQEILDRINENNRN